MSFILTRSELTVSNLRNVSFLRSLYPVIPAAWYDQGYMNNGMMVLAPGAFFLLGLIIWIQRSLTGYVEGR
jgi:Na+-transporting NADH:ubiquinone oxidoreductase subunit NqrD